jgi:hypothetical protein
MWNSGCCVVAAVPEHNRGLRLWPTGIPFGGWRDEHRRDPLSIRPWQDGCGRSEYRTRGARAWRRDLRRGLTSEASTSN